MSKWALCLFFFCVVSPNASWGQYSVLEAVAVGLAKPTLLSEAIFSQSVISKNICPCDGAASREAYAVSWKEVGQDTDEALFKLLVKHFPLGAGLQHVERERDWNDFFGRRYSVAGLGHERDLADKLTCVGICLALVEYASFKYDFLGEDPKKYTLTYQEGPNLRPSHVSHIAGRVLGDDQLVSSFLQSSPNKEYSKKGSDNFRSANDEHPPRPFGHVFLGVKIVLSGLFLVGGWLLGIRGFYRAGDALDAVLDGNKWKWFGVGSGLGLALFADGLMVAVFGYWIGMCASC